METNGTAQGNLDLLEFNFFILLSVLEFSKVLDTQSQVRIVRIMIRARALLPDT